MLAAPGASTIVAFDGTVGSGKTTLTRRVSERLGATLVPEYFDLIPWENHGQFRQMSPRKRLETLLSIERERQVTIRNLSIAVLDRSLLSIAGHEYAMAGIDPGNYIPNLPEQLHPDGIILPTVHIVLTADASSRVRRWKSRSSNMPNLFMSAQYNDRVEEYYSKLAKYLPILFFNTSKAITNSLVNDVCSAIARQQPIATGMLIKAITAAW